MACSRCIKPSDFICCCNDEFLCSNHLGDHLLTNGSHSYENLDREFPKECSQALKSKLILRIQSIQSTKTILANETKKLVSLIKTSAKIASNELSKLEDSYLNLLKVARVSNYLQQKIENILNSDLKIRKIELDFADDIKLAFKEKIISEHSKISPEENKNESKIVEGKFNVFKEKFKEIKKTYFGIDEKKYENTEKLVKENMNELEL